jgi:hypothetical protein
MYKGMNDALRHAVDLVGMGDIGNEVVIYCHADGETVYVRPAGDDHPEGTAVCAVVQRWTPDTAQIRFDGGRSEFIRV